MANEKITLELVTKLVDRGLKQAKKEIERLQGVEKRRHAAGKKNLESSRLAQAKTFKEYKKIAKLIVAMDEKYARKKYSLSRRLSQNEIATARATANKRISLMRLVHKIRKNRSMQAERDRKREYKYKMNLIRLERRAEIQASRDAVRGIRQAEKIKRMEMRKTARQRAAMLTSLHRATQYMSGGVNTVVRGLQQMAFYGAIAGSAITAIGYSILRTGAEFEKAIVNTGVIAGQFENVGQTTVVRTKILTDKARELGATTAYTATEVAAGMGDLARAGLKVDKIIGAIAPTLYLAGAAGSDLGQATKLMARTFAQFGLRAEDATNVADTFTIAMQNSLLDMESLDSSMRYAGAAAGAFGWDIRQTTAAISLFMDQSGMGSTAGTQFRHVLLSLAGPTGQAQKVIQELADTQRVSYKVMREKLNPATSDFVTILENLKPIMQDHDKILKLVNKRSSGTLQKILKDYHTGVSKYKDMMQLFDLQEGKARRDYEIQMNTVSGQTAILKSKIQESFLSIFDGLNPGLSSFMKSLNVMLDGVIRVLRASISELQIYFYDLYANSEAGAKSFNQRTEEMGTTIGLMIVRIVKFVGKIPTLFVGILKDLRWALKLIIKIWIAAKFAKFVTGLLAVAKALRAVGVASAFASGGITLIGGLLAAAGAALGVYAMGKADAAMDIESFTDSLDAENEAMERTIALHKEMEDMYVKPLWERYFGTPDETTDQDAKLKNVENMGRLYEKLGEKVQPSGDATFQEKAKAESLTSAIEGQLGLDAEGIKKGLAEGTVMEIDDPLVPEALRENLKSMMDGEGFLASMELINAAAKAMDDPKVLAEFKENMNKRTEDVQKAAATFQGSQTKYMASLDEFKELTDQAWGEESAQSWSGTKGERTTLDYTSPNLLLAGSRISKVLSGRTPEILAAGFREINEQYDEDDKESAKMKGILLGDLKKRLVDSAGMAIDPSEVIRAALDARAHAAKEAPQREGQDIDADIERMFGDKVNFTALVQKINEEADFTDETLRAALAGTTDPFTAGMGIAQEKKAKGGFQDYLSAYYKSLRDDGKTLSVTEEKIADQAQYWRVDAGNIVQKAQEMAAQLKLVRTSNEEAAKLMQGHGRKKIQVTAGSVEEELLRDFFGPMGEAIREAITLGEIDPAELESLNKGLAMFEQKVADYAVHRDDILENIRKLRKGETIETAEGKKLSGDTGVNHYLQQLSASAKESKLAVTELANEIEANWPHMQKLMDLATTKALGTERGWFAILGEKTKAEIEASKTAAQEEEGRRKAYMNKLKAWYKKLAAMEKKQLERLEKLREDETDKFANELRRRLRKTREFFKEGYRLVKNNAKRTRDLQRREAVLLAQIRAEAVLKADKRAEDQRKATKDEYDAITLSQRDKILKENEERNKKAHDNMIANEKVYAEASVAGFAAMHKSIAKLGAKGIPGFFAGEARKFLKGEGDTPGIENLLHDKQKRQAEFDALESPTSEQAKKFEEDNTELGKQIEEQMKLQKEHLEGYKTYIEALKAALKGEEISLSSGATKALENELKYSLKSRGRLAKREKRKLLSDLESGFGEIKTAYGILFDEILTAQDVFEGKRQGLADDYRDVQKLSLTKLMQFEREKIYDRRRQSAREFYDILGQTRGEQLKYELADEKKRLNEEGLTLTSKLQLRRDFQRKTLAIASQTAKELTGLGVDTALFGGFAGPKGPEGQPEREVRADPGAEYAMKAQAARKKAADGLLFREGYVRQAEHYLELADLLREHERQKIDIQESFETESLEITEGDLEAYRKELDLLKVEMGASLAGGEGQVSAQHQQRKSELIESIALEEDRLKKQKAGLKVLAALADKQNIELDETKEKMNDILEVANKIEDVWKKITNPVKMFISMLTKVYDTIKRGIDFMTGGRLELNPFTLMTEAANELMEAFEEAREKKKELDDELHAGRITTKEYRDSAELIESQKASASRVARETVDKMIEESVRFMDALVEVAPMIIKRLIQRLPEITAALEKMVPMLGTVVDELFPVFIPVIRKLFTIAARVFARVAGDLMKTAWKKPAVKLGAAGGAVLGAKLGLAGGGPLGALAGLLIGGLGGLVFGDTPHPIQVTHKGLLARFSPGDTVIAAKQPQELMRQALMAVGSEVKMATRRPPPPISSDTQGSGGSQRIDIAVIAEGRVLDAIQMQAMDRGNAPKIAKRLRKASGVKVGFNRGRYNKFAVNES